jgi:hypothetical protein
VLTQLDRLVECVIILGIVGDEMTKQDFASTSTRAARANYFGEFGDSEVNCTQWGPHPFRILNISTTGARIEALNLNRPIQPNEHFKVRFCFRDHFTYEVQVRVVYVRDGKVGVQYISPSSRFQKLIACYFKTELTGAKLRQEILNDQIAKWSSNADSDHVEVQFQEGRLSFLSIYSESLNLSYKWDLESGPSTKLGVVDDRLVRVVRNIEHMPPEHKQAIESAISFI